MEFETERYLLRDLERVFQRLYARHPTCSCVRLESLSGGCQGSRYYSYFLLWAITLARGEKKAQKCCTCDTHVRKSAHTYVRKSTA